MSTFAVIREAGPGWGAGGVWLSRPIETLALDVDATDATGTWLRRVPHEANPQSRPQPPS
jgi:hypothetical protein